MILVRMRHDNDVDPAVPRRDSPVEGDQQPVRVRAAVDEQAPASGRLHEDGIALADVEGDDVEAAIRPRDGRDGGQGDHEGEERREHPDASVGAQRARSFGAGSRPMAGRVPGCRPPAAWHPAAWHPAARPQGPCDATARREGEEGRGRKPTERCGGRGFKRDAGERQVGRRLDDQDHEPDHEGARETDQRGEDRRGAGAHGEAADHGERPGRHRERHERHDHEVEQRRKRGEPPEGEEDDRQGRRLGSERHGEPFDHEARQPWHP